MNTQTSNHLNQYQCNTSLSRDFLYQQLLSGKSLAIAPQKDKALKTIQTKSISATISTLNLKGSVQKIVIVGQALNLETLNKIIQQYFKLARYIVIDKHLLDGQFSQQAIVLSIYGSEVPSPSAKQTGKGVCQFTNKETLSELSKAYFVDAFFVTDISLSTPGLLVMDMDSTIIDMECIDEIAKLAGVGEKVSALTERAMLGELDFNQSLHARVACLDGVKLDELEKLKSRLPINSGFGETVKLLQQHGWVTCIASGGFTYFANYLKDTFELTAAISNTLTIDGGVLTGHVSGDIVNGEMKRQVLLQKLVEHDIHPQQSVAIGDGANDLLMMEVAGLGVAYKAKPRVQAAADANIRYCGFEGLLYCLTA